MCALIVLFEFLTPSFLQLLSPSYSEDASFLDWHPTSSFTLNPRNASVLLCVFFLLNSPAEPVTPTSTFPSGFFFFLMNCHLPIVCLPVPHLHHFQGIEKFNMNCCHYCKDRVREKEGESKRDRKR